ncbi:DUF2116 family Zn-ribbon domain-containing protein [Candidatus Woesearchaeota archaeon]|nr:DUF2116 family Zn-ribbon domain-containing protein [Candidatus Woesearchaeota archaeon]
MKRDKKGRFLPGNQAAAKGKVCIWCRNPIPGNMRSDALFCSRSCNETFRLRRKELESKKSGAK